MSADDETTSSFSVPDSPSPPSSPPSPFLSALDSFPLSVPHFINPIQIPPQQPQPQPQPHQPPPNAPSPLPTTFNPNPNSPSSNPNPNQAETPSQPALALPDEKKITITNLQQIIQHLSGGDFDETKYKYARMDILEIAEKKGIVFANPSWWPPEAYPDTL